MIRVQNESFDICWAEMEHPRFMVTDPNDGMMVMLAHGIVPSGDLRSMRTGDLTIDPWDAGQDVAPRRGFFLRGREVLG